MSAPVPKYRRHPNGSAFICHKSIATRDHRRYLGRYGSPDSIKRYNKFIEQLASGDRAPAVVVGPSPEIDELILAYDDHARDYYKRGDELSSEYDLMKHALTPLSELWGDTLASQFGPRSLVSLRGTLVSRGLARSTANKYITRVKRFFKWCSEQELVNPLLHHRLLCVKGLSKGQCRESDPIGPASIESFRGVLPFVSPVVSAMMRVQFMAGMRPAEVCLVRADRLDMSGDVWLYYPEKHKTEEKGFTLVKCIPPAAQAIVTPYLENRPYCFPPYRPRKPKANARRKHRLTLRERYTSETYRRAVAYGFRKAKKQGVELEAFRPNQLRHSVLTLVSEKIGHQQAQRWAGHATIDATNMYVKSQVSELIEIANQLDENLKAWA